MADFKAKFQDGSRFTASFQENAAAFSAELGETVVIKVPVPGGDVDIYEGPYVVDPVFKQRVLPTKNKTLYNDVTVNAIRVERTANAHGTTVYIGMKGD